MSRRDDSARNVDDVFGRISEALRDNGASLPATTRYRPGQKRTRPSFSELAPTIAPYQIPPLVIGDDTPEWKKKLPPSRPARDHSRDHAHYAAPHQAPRASIPPPEHSTQRVVRTGMHRAQSSYSTVGFFAIVALAVIAMGAAALAFVRPEGKSTAARVALADPTAPAVTQNATPASLPTVVVPQTQTPPASAAPSSTTKPAARTRSKGGKGPSAAVSHGPKAH